MDVEEAKEYMKNLLIALRHVHRYNVIHRDIKPSNFLYNRQQKQYALVDFGLASVAFLKDEDGEKSGKTSSCTKSTALPSKLTNSTAAKGRIPLSPSKREPGERNSANIHKCEKVVSGKCKGPVKGKASSLTKKGISPSVSSASSGPRLPDRTGLCNCFGKPMTCSVCVARSNQVAPRAGTAGFRSPEVLMKYPEQTTAVDVWAAGVIFLSILSARYPFFHAQDDMGYLAQIISVLGTDACVKAGVTIGKVLTVSESVPPIDLKSACLKLRFTQMSFQLGPHTQNSRTIQSWASIPDTPFDLLSKMLDPNPNTRISAEEALSHPFFKASEKENS